MRRWFVTGCDCRRAVNGMKPTRALAPRERFPLLQAISCATALTLLAFALPAHAQYQGQIDTSKNAPQLRAVGVLEWTGDEDHPKTSRLIPVCIYDGQDLEDASVYMSQPQPLALDSSVEYVLQQDGKPVGLFDISGAGQQQGSWVGFGAWKPLPKPKAPPRQLAKIDAENDAQSDEPILHRKHHSGDANDGGGSGSGSGAGSNAPSPDPDRPTLHKGGDASSDGSSSSGSSQSSGSGGPTLHKGGDASSGSSGDSGANSNSPPPDPDRPVLRPAPDSSSSASTGDSDHSQSKKQKSGDDAGYVEDVAHVTDPDRPHLFYGKAAGYSAPVLPSLIGLPADMYQQVAVSDAINRPVHVWDYSWANPDDQNKMKADMEDLARTTLGLNPPPASAKPTSKTSSAHKATRLTPPPAPPPLLDEQFRVFELAYGSGATMVLSAHTDGSNGPMKFVTIVAQPDLYGNVAVLLKNLTDATHLDDTPRMKLIDAVDARADNRGELLFELRGATQRQFALYRVLRGDITRIFLSSVEPIGTAAGN
jgi:hypothetical protein